MESEPLLFNELKDAFFSLIIDKSSGHDEVSFYVIKKCFSELCEPIKYLLNLSRVNPLMPGGNKKVTHTKTNLQLKAAGLFKYV